MSFQRAGGHCEAGQGCLTGLVWEAGVRPLRIFKVIVRSHRGGFQQRKDIIKSGFSVAQSGLRQRLDEEGQGQRQVERLEDGALTVVREEGGLAREMAVQVRK